MRKMQLATGTFVLACIAMCGIAHANLLVNPGFETPSTAPGVEYPGATGWSQFNAAFTVNSAVVTPNSGDQSLKVFGAASGVFQQFPASPGEIWDGGAYVLNDPVDAMVGGQVAAVNIEWRDANDQLIDFISNGDTISTTPAGEWILRPISGAAPDGTAFARLVLITGEFGGGGMTGGGGAPKFDDAFFATRVPEPSTVILAACGALGLGALARRRRVS
ncbi:PEP-CTERM sorting domain-containing protein [Aeoliella sp.]|uniref:PEP-CTERM sorting domain-containing protein n=1 Tax=Aeoliella sp. TaxID=2795800 RepID=UPI003CCBE6AC